MPENLRVRALPGLYTEMNRMPKEAVDTKQALRALPPLVKGYLRAGCRIGEGAFVDRQFDTTDVFIYLPVKDMDPALHEPLRGGVVVLRLSSRPSVAKRCEGKGT